MNSSEDSHKEEQSETFKNNNFSSSDETLLSVVEDNGTKNNHDELTSNWEEALETFDDMSLTDEILRGIYDYGFEKPSALQQRAIRPIIMGRDLIAQAQSGTGKTATFAIGTLASIDTSIEHCQSLILAPNRELAWAYFLVMRALAKYTNVEIHICVGGNPIREDIRALQTEEIHCVVGTPGRVGDLISRRALDVKHLRQFILDEADEMLSNGSKEQIYDVFKYLPETTQVCLFSATMPLEVLNITKHLMDDPVRILVKKDELSTG